MRVVAAAAFSHIYLFSFNYLTELHLIEDIPEPPYPDRVHIYCVSDLLVRII